VKEKREHWTGSRRKWEKVRLPYLSLISAKIYSAANTTPFLVPFDQNSQFIGRELQLAEIEQKLFVGALTTKVAITGPGGIGKTQLALALAYRIRQKYKNCSVFWISASDKESIHQGYTHIARQLAIPGWDDEKADVKKLVQLYLSKESAGQWFLILDNADKATIESAGLPKVVSLMEFLPSSKQGAIVFTTADKETAIKLAPHDIIELPELEKGIAQRMLETCLVKPADEQEEASLLIKELAYLPLAIVQAAAYINVNKTTLQGYLSLLIEKKEKLAGNLHQEFGGVIAATWLISFEQIRRHNDLAADYLLFMACVDRNDIPLALLPTARPYEQGIHAVATLHTYSLVTKRTAESALDLHRLVHISTRNLLQEQKLLSQWTQAAVTRLLEVFPDNKHGSRSKWRRLLPHAKYALSSDLTEQYNEARTDLIWKCAVILHTDGRSREAEELLVQVLEIRKRALGDEHPETLMAMDNLATVLGCQGKYEAAEAMSRQTLLLEETVLGREHPSTLTAMSNLALVLDSRGNYEAAEVMNRQTLLLSETVFGHEHPSTLRTMSNLALVLGRQGNYEAAEAMNRQTLLLSETVLGREHPSTLTTMSNLALVLSRQGKYKAAEAMTRQTLSLKETVLGREHPSTLTTMSILATVLDSQGNYEAAEAMNRQTLSLKERVLGREHPLTLTTMSNLALVLSRQGKYKAAEAMTRQTLLLSERVLGREHPETLTTMSNLAAVLDSRGNYEAAEAMNRQTLLLKETVLGREHPETLTTMSNLATVLGSQGKYEAAEAMNRKTLLLKEAVLGREHPLTLTSVYCLAYLLASRHRYDESFVLYERACTAYSAVLGEDHPTTYTCRQHYLEALASQKQDRA
jgi:tetratricopeptide (TPR) repeat protein